jgi:outer membrane biosynthesis protein TonB
MRKIEGSRKEVVVSEPGKSQSGGNLKYVIGGLVLLLGAGAVVFMLRPSAPPPAPSAPPAPPASAERVNPMAQPDLILDETKDAGAPAQVAEAEKPKPHAAREARDEWDCDGDLSRAALQSVIDNNRAQVRNCYERRLKVNNVLQGDLKLKIKVGSNGQIAAATVGGSLKDNEVFGCVRSLAQRWSFPPPTGGTCAVVQVPFQFSPKTN